MARIELAPEVLLDIERILQHLDRYEVEQPEARIAQIVDAIDVLRASPLIGRPTRAGKQELVIGRGSRGYVVLYRYIESVDTVFILAVRSQRESGFKRRRSR